MQAVLFEIQLIRSRSANPSGKGKSAKAILQVDLDKIDKTALTPDQILALESSNNLSRRGSHGVKSILLKGEMRCVRDINMLVFLCSPL